MNDIFYYICYNLCAFTGQKITPPAYSMTFPEGANQYTDCISVMPTGVGSETYVLWFEPVEGFKGYIAQWIDVIFNNPLIEFCVLLFIVGAIIAFLKRIKRV